jgi:hypothetical protein
VLWEFHRRIIGLIGRSKLVETEALVQEAIRLFGSQPLKTASAIENSSLRIVGWQQLCTDLLDADANLKSEVGKPSSLAMLSVYNRTDDNRPMETKFTDGRLTIGRSFYAAFTRAKYGGVQVSPRIPMQADKAQA